MYEWLFQKSHKECPICGKGFILPPENAYKLTNTRGRAIHYCSYTCFMKAQKKKETDRKYKVRDL